MNNNNTIFSNGIKCYNSLKLILRLSNLIFKINSDSMKKNYI